MVPSVDAVWAIRTGKAILLVSLLHGLVFLLVAGNGSLVLDGFLPTRRKPA